MDSKYPHLQKVLAETEPNAYLTKSDPFVIILYDRDQTIDMFGEDMLTDYGVAIPPELIERYKKVKAESDQIQAELSKILKDSETKRWG